MLNMPKPSVFCLKKRKEKFSELGIDTPAQNLRGDFLTFLAKLGLGLTKKTLGQKSLP